MAKNNFGKYRATVAEVQDPDLGGKIKVKCPKVLGDSVSAWCMPCTAYSSEDVGFIDIPNEGDLVWVEFEEGDADKPIYSGRFWKDGKTPLTKASSDLRVFKFEGGQIMAFDKSGNICLRTGSSIFLMQKDQIVVKSPVMYNQPTNETADSIFSAVFGSDIKE